MIDCELEIVQMEIEHPEQFADTYASEPPRFGFHLATGNKHLGLIGIAEVVVGLWLSEQIIGANGKPAPLVRLANAFEYALGINFGDIYDKLEAIYERKPFNRTKALDYLRALIVNKEIESQNTNGK